MYKTDENKNNPRMQNAIENENLAAPMFEKNPNQLYPQVKFVNNPMPISSDLSEVPGKDPNVIYLLGNVPPKFDAGTHGNAPSTSKLLSQ